MIKKKFAASEVISKKKIKGVGNPPPLQLRLELNLNRKNGIYDSFSEFLSKNDTQ